jgi:hypothetical protein
MDLEYVLPLKAPVEEDLDELAAYLREISGWLDVTVVDGSDAAAYARFQPLPWHARWDTARSLVNRTFGADHPGTYVLRRSTFCRMGGYDGDVLFKNLEMSRTIRAAGGREVSARSIFVVPRPPTARPLPQPAGSARPSTTSPSRPGCWSRAHCCRCCSASAARRHAAGPAGPPPD